MKLTIAIGATILTLALVWLFWLTPTKVEYKAMFKSMPIPEVVGPAPTLQQKASGWVDLAGKCSPIVSTGIAVATFMSNRKKKSKKRS